MQHQRCRGTASESPGQGPSRRRLGLRPSLCAFAGQPYQLGTSASRFAPWPLLRMRAGIVSGEVHVDAGVTSIGGLKTQHREEDGENVSQPSRTRNVDGKSFEVGETVPRGDKGTRGDTRVALGE